MDAKPSKEVEQQGLLKHGLGIIKEALLLTLPLNDAEEAIRLIKVKLRRRFPGSFFLK